MTSVFLALDKEIQHGILDMYHPPLSSQNSQFVELRSQEARIVGSKLSVDEKLVEKLIAICDYNAHKYSTGKLAPFLYGSKVAHSCSPNVT